MVQLPWWPDSWDLYTPALGAASVSYHGMDLNGCYVRLGLQDGGLIRLLDSSLK
jgi:hypothetical protein